MIYYQHLKNLNLDLINFISGNLEQQLKSYFGIQESEFLNFGQFGSFLSHNFTLHILYIDIFLF